MSSSPRSLRSAQASLRSGQRGGLAARALAAGLQARLDQPSAQTQRALAKLAARRRKA